MEPNFSGYVSKADTECADGRVIMKGAFKHQDNMRVPLVFQHNHDDVNQVLGHVILKDKEDGLWGDVYLNDTPSAATADMLVKHGDVDKFSIWAKNLEERGFNVHRGDVQEVSLVLAGANPGANIANVLAHSGLDDDDQVFLVGGEIKHSDTDEEKKETSSDEKKDEGEDDDETVGDVLDTLNEDQRTAINAIIGDVVEEAVTEALTEEADKQVQHSNIDSSEKGNTMSRNVFDRSKESNSAGPELKHSDVEAVLTVAKGNPSDGVRGINQSNATTSLRELVRSSKGKELMHADTYGLDNIEVLFPEAQALMNTPVFVDRRQDWVKKFMAGTGKSPFSRVKTVYADITADEARARGYIKGNQKVDEVFPIFKRETGPAWIYKRQKLDRQDIIDIVDFDVVAWMKAEMRGKLDEEIARAGLFGDGRPAMLGGDVNPDKIPDPGAAASSGNGIRSVIADNDLYTSKFEVPMSATPTQDDYQNLIDEVTINQEHYMGSGNITAFMSFRNAAKLLTIRDSFGHRLYKTLADVAGEMGVSEIVRVPTALFDETTLLVLLDLGDYNFGTNRGGEVTLFDDFDIDFNQFKYLIETYLSGALTLPYSAQVYTSVESTNQAIVPTAPVEADNVVTIPVQVGVVYKNADTDTTLSQGTTYNLTAIDNELNVIATTTGGYVVEEGAETTWTFTFQE